MFFNIGNGPIIDMNLFTKIQNELVPELVKRVVAKGYPNVAAQAEILGDTINVVFTQNNFWVCEFAIINVNGNLSWMPVHRTA